MKIRSDRGTRFVNRLARIGQPLLLVGVWLAFAPVEARAVSPANDLCSGAAVIPPSGPFPYRSPVVDISNAAITGDPPLPSPYPGIVSRSVWYVFTPAASTTYTISTCVRDATSTTVADTIMALYTSPAGCLGPFTRIGDVHDEDDGCASQAIITQSLLADTTYYVVIWKYYNAGAPDDGNNLLQIVVDGSVPPPNDVCASATPVALNIPAHGTTIGAGNHYQISGTNAFWGIGQQPTNAAGRDVVYSFTAPSAGNYSFKVFNYDVNQDAVLYVASGCPAGTPPISVGGLLGAANRSAANAAEEVVCLPLMAGQQVFAFVDDGKSGNTGSTFDFEVTACVREDEPNDTPTNAAPFSCGVEGAIAPAGDVDFFSLGRFPIGWRVFALLDGEAARTSDFDLRVTTETATLEYDNDNNTTTFGEKSPNIAGTPLDGSPAFLSVSYESGFQIEPYRLYAVVQPPLVDATLESEPNNSLEQANVGEGGYFRGTLTPTDKDVFVVNVAEGDLLFVSLDADPLRDNTPIDAQLELIDEFGASRLVIDDAGSASNTNGSPNTLEGGTPYSPAEGFVYRASQEGTFYVRVSIAPGASGSLASGDYLLSISRNCRIGGLGGNHAPTLTNLAVTSPVIEGNAATLSGTVFELDLGDTGTLLVTWGDGTSNIVNYAAGRWDFNLTHTYVDDNPTGTASDVYNVTVTATDNHGGNSSSANSVTVTNIPPLLANVVITTPVFANDLATLSGSIVEVNPLDTFILAVNWGDGSAVQNFNYPAGTTSFSETHRYATGNATYTLQLALRDDDSGTNSANTQIHVRLRPTAARFLSIVRLPGGNMRLQLEATPEGLYRIEKANTFGAWNELGTRTADAAGRIEIDDTAPTSQSRFYRAVVAE